MAAYGNMDKGLPGELVGLEVTHQIDSRLAKGAVPFGGLCFGTGDGEQVTAKGEGALLGIAARTALDTHRPRHSRIRRWRSRQRLPHRQDFRHRRRGCLRRRRSVRERIHRQDRRKDFRRRWSKAHRDDYRCRHVRRKQGRYRRCR